MAITLHRNLSLSLTLIVVVDADVDAAAALPASVVVCFYFALSSLFLSSLPLITQSIVNNEVK